MCDNNKNVNRNFYNVATENIGTEGKQNGINCNVNRASNVNNNINMINKRGVNWVFTLFLDKKNSNYNEKLELLKQNVKWCVYQVEKTPSTGKHHLQGVFGLKKQERYSAVLQYFKSPLYIDVARNTYLSIKYCLKSETRVSGPYYLGNPLHIPRIKNILYDMQLLEKFKVSAKILEYTNLIKNGKITYEKLYLLDSQFLRQHDRYFSKIICNLNVRYVDRKCCFSYIYGGSGLGKSLLSKHFAYQLEEHVFFYTNESGWWDGYKGEKVVVIDEFVGVTMSAQVLNRIVDGSTINLNIKNGTVQNNIDNIIICSNNNLERNFNIEIYRNAVNRRITNMIYINNCSNIKSNIILTWDIYNVEIVPKFLTRSLCITYKENDVVNAIDEVFGYVCGEMLYVDAKFIKVLRDDIYQTDDSNNRLRVDTHKQYLSKREEWRANKKK